MSEFARASAVERSVFNDVIEFKKVFEPKSISVGESTLAIDYLS